MSFPLPTQACLCRVSSNSTRDGKEPKNRNTVFSRTTRRKPISNSGHYCLSHDRKVPEVEAGSWKFSHGENAQPGTPVDCLSLPIRFSQMVLSTFCSWLFQREAQSWKTGSTVRTPDREFEHGHASMAFLVIWRLQMPQFAGVLLSRSCFLPSIHLLVQAVYLIKALV